MKTHSYPFARFFIKIAIGLAILAVLIGAALAANHFFSMQARLASARYQTDPDLGILASRLEKSYTGTQRRLLRSLDTDAFPSTVPLVDFSKQLATAERAGGAAQASAFLDLAQQTSNSLEAIKKYHFSQFAASIDSLRQALLAHAAELRQKYAQKQQQPSLTPAVVPTPTPAVKPPASGEFAFRIYADNPGNDQERLQSIKSVKQLLEELQAQSQKQESIDEIRRASIYLTRAESLLDLLKKEEAALEHPEQTPAQKHEVEEDLVSRAEQIASELARARALMEDNLYTRWIANVDCDNLSSKAGNDLNQAAAAEATARQIWVDGLRSMGGYFLAGLIVAFGILVIADFLRAFLNMSNNTDTLAGAQLEVSENQPADPVE